jgi:hypothetical protein
MTIEELKQFFEERPALSVRGVNDDAGLSQSYLGKVLRGERTLSQNIIDKLLPVLKKYGYGYKEN